MKRYLALLLLLCSLYLGCSEFPINYHERPHKEIRAMTWSPDGQTLVVFVSYPTGQTTQSKFYIYNVKGEKVSETPPLGLQRYYFSEFYLSSDAKYVVVGSYPAEVVELATGKVVTTYNTLTTCSQVFGTDEYIVTDDDQRYSSGPYYEYKKVLITGNTIDTLTRFRLLAYYGYVQSFSPTFASEKRIITNEYDSLNNIHIVVRDSSFNVLFNPIPPEDRSFSKPTISISGDKVIFGGYSDNKFILDLSSGAIDTSHVLTFGGDKMALSRDGNRIYGSPKNTSSIQSYDISSRIYASIRSFPNTSYAKLIALSPDDKYIAYVLYDFNSDDQLMIAPL